MQRLTIATRASPLALWQAEHVQTLLGKAHPQLAVELLRIPRGATRCWTVRSPRSEAKAVHQGAGGGADGRARGPGGALVKDVPMQLEPQFEIGAVLEREDPRDCLVCSRFGSLQELPAGARVGTSSLRRELALRIHHPALRVGVVRGNVGTRLAKQDRGEFDALIMAAAGLKRLGLADRIRAILPTAQFLPAPAQGALAIEIRAGDNAVRALIAHLEHAPTRAATRAERMVSRALGGSCQVPLAAYAEVQGGELRLRAWAGNVARAQAVYAQASGPSTRPRRWGAGGRPDEGAGRRATAGSGSGGGLARRSRQRGGGLTKPGTPKRGTLALVTRPGEPGQRLSTALRDRGQRALWWPAFDLLAPAELEPLQALLQRLAEFELAVFVSPAAVRACRRWIFADHGGRNPDRRGRGQHAAVGPQAVAGCGAARGIGPVPIPRRPDPKPCGTRCGATGPCRAAR